MVAQEAPRPMSVAQWRELLRASELKYEYRAGWVYAMAGGSADHSRIAINLIRALEDGLGDRPCLVYNSDMAARLSPTDYTFPDATVTCDAHDQGRVTEVQAPRVIVEVLSDSTERDDRTEKFALCRACPSMQEYVLIATRYQGIEVYRRAAGDWTAHVYTSLNTVELASIDVRLPVSTLYRRTSILPAELPRPTTPAPER